MFAKAFVERRGKVSDQELATVSAAGYTDQEIVDITALTVQFVFTNFLNNMADTEADVSNVSPI